MSKANEMARALFQRAGGGSAVAIAVDTRPKKVRARKGRGSYSRKPKHHDRGF